MSKQNKMEEYDSEPVTYCSKCYSIKIKYEESIGMDCCEDCGCTDFKTSTFEEWEKLYERRYGHKFMEEKGDIKKSPMFQLTNDQLKREVANNPLWKCICRTLYPDFPNWLNKADSIILLFAKLYQDNRLDDLRIELINQDKNKRYGRAEEIKNSKH